MYCQPQKGYKNDQKMTHKFSQILPIELPAWSIPAATTSSQSPGPRCASGRPNLGIGAPGVKDASAGVTKKSWWTLSAALLFQSDCSAVLSMPSNLETSSSPASLSRKSLQAS